VSTTTTLPRLAPMVCLTALLVGCAPEQEPRESATLSSLLDRLADEDLRTEAASSLWKLYRQENQAAAVDYMHYGRGHYSWRTLPLLPSVMRRLPTAAPEFKPVLLQFLETSNEIGDLEHVEYLEQLALSDASSDTRSAAIRLLGRWRAARSLPVLIKLSRTSNAEARGWAISVLGNFEREEARRRLIEILKDGTPEEKCHAARQLVVKWCYRPAVGVLVALLRCNDGVTRSMAISELQQLTGLYLGRHVVFKGLKANATDLEFTEYWQSVPDDDKNELLDDWTSLWTSADHPDSEKAVAAIERWWRENADYVYVCSYPSGVRLEVNAAAKAAAAAVDPQTGLPEN